MQKFLADLFSIETDSCCCARKAEGGALAPKHTKMQLPFSEAASGYAATVKNNEFGYAGKTRPSPPKKIQRKQDVEEVDPRIARLRRNIEHSRINMLVKVTCEGWLTRSRQRKKRYYVFYALGKLVCYENEKKELLRSTVTTLDTNTLQALYRAELQTAESFQFIKKRKDLEQGEEYVCDEKTAAKWVAAINDALGLLKRLLNRDVLLLKQAPRTQHYGEVQPSSCWLLLGPILYEGFLTTNLFGPWKRFMCVLFCNGRFVFYETHTKDKFKASYEFYDYRRDQCVVIGAPGVGDFGYHFVVHMASPSSVSYETLNFAAATADEAIAWLAALPCLFDITSCEDFVGGAGLPLDPKHQEYYSKATIKPQNMMLSPQSRMSNVKVVHEGWMMKQGHLVKNWKRRYFQLRTDGVIAYYSEQKGKCIEADKKGEYVCFGSDFAVGDSGLEIAVGEGFLEKGFTFTLRNRAKTALRLATDTEAERTAWLEAIARTEDMFGNDVARGLDSDNIAL